MAQATKLQSLYRSKVAKRLFDAKKYDKIKKLLAELFDVEKKILQKDGELNYIELNVHNFITEIEGVYELKIVKDLVEHESLINLKKMKDKMKTQAVKINANNLENSENLSITLGKYHEMIYTAKKIISCKPEHNSALTFLELIKKIILVELVARIKIMFGTLKFANRMLKNENKKSEIEKFLKSISSEVLALEPVAQEPAAPSPKLVAAEEPARAPTPKNT